MERRQKAAVSIKERSRPCVSVRASGRQTDSLRGPRHRRVSFRADKREREKMENVSVFLCARKRGRDSKMERKQTTKENE